MSNEQINLGISPDEALALSMMRLNKATPKLEIKKTLTIGKLRISFKWRSKKNLWGRFGGGWNWKLGMQIGSATVILDLLTFTIRFDKVIKPKPACACGSGVCS